MEIKDPISSSLPSSNATKRYSYNTHLFIGDLDLVGKEIALAIQRRWWTEIFELKSFHRFNGWRTQKERNRFLILIYSSKIHVQNGHRYPAKE